MTESCNRATEWTFWWDCFRNIEHSGTILEQFNWHARVITVLYLLWGHNINLSLMILCFFLAWTVYTFMNPVSMLLKCCLAADPQTWALCVNQHLSVKSSRFYLYTPISQITICLKGLFNLHSIQHPLSLDRRIGLGKTSQKKPCNRERKPQAEQQRRDLSPRMDRHTIDVECTE